MCVYNKLKIWGIEMSFYVKYNDRKVKIRVDAFLLVTVLVGIVFGYVNGGSTGALLGLVFAVLLSFLTVAGFVPFVGFLIYIYLANKVGEILNEYVIRMGELTFKLMFWIELVPAIIFTVITSFMITVGLYFYKKEF
jgi:hypothetical protein